MPDWYADADKLYNHTDFLESEIAITAYLRHGAHVRA